MSTVSIAVIISYVIWSIKRSCLQIQSSLCQMLTEVFHTSCYVISNHKIVYWFFSVFADYDKKHSLGVAGKHRLYHSFIEPDSISNFSKGPCILSSYFIFFLLTFDNEHYRHHHNSFCSKRVLNLGFFPTIFVTKIKYSISIDF